LRHAFLLLFDLIGINAKSGDVFVAFCALAMRFRAKPPSASLRALVVSQNAHVTRQRSRHRLRRYVVAVAACLMSFMMSLSSPAQPQQPWRYRCTVAHATQMRSAIGCAPIYGAQRRCCAMRAVRCRHVTLPHGSPCCRRRALSADVARAFRYFRARHETCHSAATWLCATTLRS